MENYDRISGQKEGKKKIHTRSEPDEMGFNPFHCVVVAEPDNDTVRLRVTEILRRRSRYAPKNIYTRK